LSKKATKAKKKVTKKSAASRKPATKTTSTKKAAKKAPTVKKKVAKKAPAKKAVKKAAVSRRSPAKKATKKSVKKVAAAKKKTTTAKTSKKAVKVVAKKAPVKKRARARKSGKARPVDLAPGQATAAGAIYYDSHMHTPLCKHAWGEPEEYAEQGVRSGLKGITFTCHAPMPNGFWPIVRMSESEFDMYLQLVERTKAAFENQLDVGLGIESEYFPGCEEAVTALHQRADFDYVLGGLHWQAKEYLGKYETGTIEGFRRTYFDHLAESAESGLYDCLAHPDLVKNYHPDSWCFAILKPSIADALDRIAKTGIAMELNTSGLNKSYSEMNPGLEMLGMMAERGIPVVIGSDAHRPHRVGEHFPTALIQLQDAGYTKVNYFKKRERIELPISKVLASIKKASDANA
jgi:histidinol-phosphatase (PHP family)